MILTPKNRQMMYEAFSDGLTQVSDEDFKALARLLDQESLRRYGKE